MAKISEKDIEHIYIVSKEIYNGSLKRSDGINTLASTGINENSISDYVSNFKNLMDGIQYTRTMNAYATEYFLNNIYKDFGSGALSKALSAVYKHLNYYESLTGTRKQKIRNVLANFISIDGDIYAGEVDDSEEYFEGATKKIYINVYERDKKVRAKCLAHYGFKCAACNISLDELYGSIGENVIHVHHLVELSTIKKQYKVDPIQDLRPVCPNCHTIIHKRRPAYTIEEVKSFLEQSKSDKLV